MKATFQGFFESIKFRIDVFDLFFKAELALHKLDVEIAADDARDERDDHTPEGNRNQTAHLEVAVKKHERRTQETEENVPVEPVLEIT